MRMTDRKIIELRSNIPVARTLLLSDLGLFISVFHWYMHRKQFIFKPFHEKIVQKLQDIALGKNEKQNLYIGIAPRFGKSQITVYFIAYGFALNRMSNFIHTSYGSDLVAKFSSQIRDIVSSDLFGEIFGLRVDQSTSAKDLWKIENGGEFRAASLNGVITGFGAGTIEDGWGGALMIDDFMKADDYRSETVKKSVIDLYENTLKSRRNNKRTPIIIIAQRLATDDLIGYIEKNEPQDWDLFTLPTLDENDKSIWEAQKTTESLIKMREVNPFLFYSQYQQSPIILGGSVMKEEWFRFYPTSDVPYKRLFMTADTAMKTKECNDYTAVGLWGLTSKDELYLLDMLHGKWEAPDLERQMLAFWTKWRGGINNCPVTAVYIEDKASGIGLIQSMKHRGGIPIIPIKPDADKLVRARNVTPYIEAGLLYLPHSKDFQISREVIAEATAFSADDSHKHDDICDMMFYALEMAYYKTPIKISDEWDVETEDDF